MAKLPSEVKDGIIVMKRKFRFRTTCNLPEIAEALGVLLKKLERFEVSVARMGKEKSEAVKFLIGVMLQQNVEGERLEKVTASMKAICESDSKLKGVLDKASGKDLIALLTKTEQEYGEQLEIETLVVNGKQMMNEGIFDFKWNQTFVKRELLEVETTGDGIAYVELLAHNLNARTIRATPYEFLFLFLVSLSTSSLLFA